MANAGAHRRMSVGKPTVVSIEIPHMPDVAYMFDDLRCNYILYYKYGDMYVQVIVMLLDVTFESTFVRTKIPLLVSTNRRYCFRHHIKLLGDDSDSTYHATL